MRVAILFSGGKDSVYATHWAISQGFEPVLVTVRPPEYSMMFHHPNVKATKMQAEALGVGQVFVGVTEDNWQQQLLKTLKRLKVQAIVSGAVASTYQKTRVDGVAKELGIPSYAPLWHKEPEFLDRMLKEMKVYVTAVSAEGLGPEFLGKPLENLIEFVRAKKLPIHPFLEGGEGETFVTDAPLFKKRIRIKKWKKSWDGVRGVAEIKKAEFEQK